MASDGQNEKVPVTLDLAGSCGFVPGMHHKDASDVIKNVLFPIIYNHLRDIGSQSATNTDNYMYDVLGGCMMFIIHYFPINLILYKSTCRGWFGLQNMICGYDNYHQYIQALNCEKKGLVSNARDVMEWTANHIYTEIFKPRFIKEIRRRGAIGSIIVPKYEESTIQRPKNMTLDQLAIHTDEIKLCMKLLECTPSDHFTMDHICEKIGISIEVLSCIADDILQFAGYSGDHLHIQPTETIPDSHPSDGICDDLMDVLDTNVPKISDADIEAWKHISKFFTGWKKNGSVLEQPKLPNIIIPEYYVPASIRDRILSLCKDDSPKCNIDDFTNAGGCHKTNADIIWSLQAKTGGVMRKRVRVFFKKSKDFLMFKDQAYRNIACLSKQYNCTRVEYMNNMVLYNWLEYILSDKRKHPVFDILPSDESKSFAESMEPYLPIIHWAMHRYSNFPSFLHYSDEGDLIQEDRQLNILEKKSMRMIIRCSEIISESAEITT